MIMSLVENNPIAQKEGIVRVFYNIDSPAHTTSHNEFIKKGSIFSRALPMNNMGLHFCYNSDALVSMLSAVQLAVGVDGRSRLRDHFGKHLMHFCPLVLFFPSTISFISQDMNKK